MSQVYIFLADGFEEIEGLTVVDMLRRARIDITTVSVMNKEEIVSSHNVKILADELFGKSDYTKGDMIVLPGGKVGTDNLASYLPVIKLLKEYEDKNKYIAAICAAPSVLGINGILKNKEAICYPGFEDKLIGAKIVNKNVVHSKNIITSKGMGTTIDFALEIIATLKSKEEAEKIRNTIQYTINA